MGCYFCGFGVFFEFYGAEGHGGPGGGVNVGAETGKTQQRALDPGLCSGAC